MNVDASVPRHIAIVMDGNGRWAKKRFLPRFFGHKAGVDAVVRTVQACIDRRVEQLTVFAFSSENWRRPKDEVSGLMGLVLAAMSRYMARMNGMGVRIRIVGDRDGLSDKLRMAWMTPRRSPSTTTSWSSMLLSTTAGDGTSFKLFVVRCRPE